MTAVRENGATVDSGVLATFGYDDLYKGAKGRQAAIVFWLCGYSWPVACLDAKLAVKSSVRLIRSFVRGN